MAFRRRARGAEPLARYMRRVVPYWRHVGIELVSLGRGISTFRMRVRRIHDQNGVAHGGAIASLLDSALAVSALTRLYPAAYATTSQMHVTYLRPAKSGVVTARARCLKAGRTLLFCEAKAYGPDGRLLATASSELFRIRLPVAPRAGSR